MTKEYRVDFETIKAGADFRAVLAHYGLEPIGQGGQTKVRCPFHDDERPSCSVNLEKRLFHCHAGSCGALGNVLEFVHRMETRDGATTSLRQAAVKLATICSIPLASGNGERRPKEARREGSATVKGSTTAGEGNGAPGAPTAPGEATLKPNKPLSFALDLDPGHPYLVERGVPGIVIMPFGLGYSGKGIMAGRLCIPIHNAGGELVAYAGRWVGSEADLPAGEEKYKLPKGFHKSLELFNLHRVKACRHVVVVEGYFGALRLHSLRKPAVALMGSSMSDAQVALLQEHCPDLRHVTVMLDGDEAGRTAAEGVAVKLARHWWVRIVSLPDGGQPDTVELDMLEHLLGRIH
jgi:DNA primase